MHYDNTNVGSWEAMRRRNWCNGGFRQALDPNLRNAFKKFKCITGQSNETGAGAANITTQDYFSLAAGREVSNGGGTSGLSYSTDTEAYALRQFTWYQITSHRIKTKGEGGSAQAWYERSPDYARTFRFCMVNEQGARAVVGPSNYEGLAPFGCI